MSDFKDIRRLLHVQGQDLVEIELKDNVDLLDGDVYIFDEGINLWIWVGKDSSVDEHAIAAWLVNKIDTEERRGVPEVYTMNQGMEKQEFLDKFSFTVLDGDTPGFLRKAELDMVEYKLYHIYTSKETLSFDEAHVDEVELSRSSLKSGDVYVLDGNGIIYCWIGEGANVEEKRAGQKLMQTIDAERHYLPLQYTIYENENSKSEKAFYEFLEVAAKTEGPVVSIEDQRELMYRPEEAKSTEEHKKDIDQLYEVATESSPVLKPKKSEIQQKFDLNMAIRGLAPNATFERSDATTKAGGFTQQTSNSNSSEDDESLLKPSSYSEENKYTGSTAYQLETQSGVPIESQQREASQIDKNLRPSYADCVAKDMHQFVFKEDMACSVCNVTPDVCIARDMHEIIFKVDKPCSVCGVVN